MPRLIVLPLCVVLLGVVLLSACSGAGVRARETRTTPTSPPASTSSTSSTTSTSSVVPSTQQGPQQLTTSTTRSRPPVAVRSAAAGDVGGQSALASWYGDESGSRTASGERFDPSGATFANRSMPFGTLVRFTYGGRSVVGRCNDRGPFAGGRTFDLARGLFAQLAPTSAGVISLRWEVVSG